MQHANTPKRRNGCPVCNKAPTTEQAPFCSQGCRDRDLLQWLQDGYHIPGPPSDDENSDMLLDKGSDTPL